MKLLWVLFSLYLLTLAISPCHEHDCLQDGNVVLSELHQHHESGTNSFELCSPFCSQACCVGIVCTNPDVFNFSVINHYTALINDGYQVSFIHQMPKSIWQPPKIG